MGLFCTSAKPDRRHSRSTRSSTKATSATGSTRGAGGVKRAIQNRDIIRMFEGLTVSDSFLLKSNIREMLLRRRQTP